MHRWQSITQVAVAIWLIVPTSGSWAQKTSDSSFQSPTTADLIQQLTPQGEPPLSHAGGTRGLKLQDSQEKPQIRCEHYWQQVSGQGASRGIQLKKPEMKSVALPVTFATNSAELTLDAKRTLDDLGNALKNEKLSACCFQIEGHTDNRGNAQHNLQLSKRRADSVRLYLEEKYDLKERAVGVGFGQTQPVAENTTDEGRQKNRRVQVVNLGYGK
jgi:OOP family OmpA-OmpF porin